MSDVYSAPESDLIATADDQEFGSVEKAVTGQYQFKVFEVLEEAWEKTSGAKGSIWLGILFYILVAIGVSVVFQVLLAVLGEGSALAIVIAEQITLTAIGAPLLAGIMMIAIKRSINAPRSGTLALNYFHKTLPLLLTLIIMYVLIAIGFVLLIIPGIYLSVAYYFGSILVVEKNMSPWEALETSRKAITHRWFAVFGLALMTILINIVGMIPLGIGLIWTVPLTALSYGILYRNMFGVEAVNRQ